jgi:hypothetical protein
MQGVHMLRGSGKKGNLVTAHLCRSVLLVGFRPFIRLVPLGFTLYDCACWPALV